MTVERVARRVPTERVHLPGGRDGLAASLDGEERSSSGNRTQSGNGDDRGRAVVVACPPHPEHGGNRHDARLRAASEALPDRIDCLRFDYGPWDEGRGEREDARAAIAWATDRYDRVGLFGYSFGGGVALLTAAGGGDPKPSAAERAADALSAAAALSPVARLGDGSDVVAAVGRVNVPLWIGHGTRDDTVDAARVAEAVRERGGTVETFPADHFFVGREAAVGERAAAFFADALRGESGGDTP